VYSTFCFQNPLSFSNRHVELKQLPSPQTFLLCVVHFPFLFTTFSTLPYSAQYRFFLSTHVRLSLTDFGSRIFTFPYGLIAAAPPGFFIFLFFPFSYHLSFSPRSVNQFSPNPLFLCILFSSSISFPYLPCPHPRVVCSFRPGLFFCCVLSVTLFLLPLATNTSLPHLPLSPVFPHVTPHNVLCLGLPS